MNQSLRSATLVGCLLLCAAAPPVSAATFTVYWPFDAARDPAADPCLCRSQGWFSLCTLRAAVQTANVCPGADTIVLASSGTYPLVLAGSGTTDNDPAQGDLDITETVTIRSQSEPEPVSATVDASLIADRIFDIQPGSGTVTLQGFKVRGGYLDPNVHGRVKSNGGCIRVRSSVLHLFTLIVGDDPNIDKGCVGHHGGGLYAEASTVWVYDSIVSDGDARTWVPAHGTPLDGYGGGLGAFDSDLLVEDSYILSSESTGSGGGVFAIDFDEEEPDNFVRLIGSVVQDNRTVNAGGGAAFAAAFEVIDSDFLGNATLDSSTSGGGGIFVASSLAPQGSIEGSRIWENVAPRGGGISIAGAASILRTDIAHNTAIGPGLGGGIYARRGSMLHVEDSSVHGNLAVDGGGAYLAGVGGWVNSTIAENEVERHGGGFLLDKESDIAMLHVTVRDNVAQSGTGGGIHADLAAAVTLDRSILYGNHQSNGPAECDGPVKSLGMVVTDPASCVLAHPTDIQGTATDWGSLAYNPPQPPFTATIEVFGANVSLDRAAPCGVRRDQRGVPRNPEVCDVGAYENP